MGRYVVPCFQNTDGIELISTEDLISTHESEAIAVGMEVVGRGVISTYGPSSDIVICEVMGGELLGEDGGEGEVREGAEDKEKHGEWIMIHDKV